jgi:hypothetical protein
MGELVVSDTARRSRNEKLSVVTAYQRVGVSA